MPIYEPKRVEYATVSGRVAIVTDDRAQMPGYWAHPDIGGRFPAVAILHDWWGVTAVERRLANLLASIGYYTILPDFFDGQTATNPQDAIRLVEQVLPTGYDRVTAALSALDAHVRCNHQIAVLGIGLGGSFAFEAAIRHPRLAAAVACYGFPQRYFGRFVQAQAPILALYGDREPHTSRADIDRLRAELATSPIADRHQVMILEGAARGFFEQDASLLSARAWALSADFIDRCLRPN